MQHMEPVDLYIYCPGVCCYVLVISVSNTLHILLDVQYTESNVKPEPNTLFVYKYLAHEAESDSERLLFILLVHESHVKLLM